MKNSKYAEISNAVQIIGCVYKNPSLFENEKYKFNEEDFFDSFHKIVFGTIHNLWLLGAKEITLTAIEDYLNQRPKALAVYKSNKGAEFILKCAENANLNTFDYYYNRSKKMSLLRAYEDMGLNLSWLYDPDELFDSKKKQEQEDWLDSSSLAEIYDAINDKIDNIKLKYVDEIDESGSHLSKGIDELLQSFEESPSYGYPLYGDYINTVFRGARLGKFYLRSAATGVGKTRSMVADLCYIGCEQMYSLKENKWITIGESQPCLFIATEQQIDEIQTVCLSFIAGVNEEHILTNEYYAGEKERIIKAAQLLKQSKIFFECLPNFTMNEIEMVIKKNIRENQVQYIFYDYLHSSAKILGEVGTQSGIKGLREDNVLLLLSNKLKEIAVTYDVFVMSATQLNMDYKASDTPDQNLLRGAKAIGDKIDAGMIMLESTSEDIEKLRPFCEKNGIPVPNIKMSIYKNRQGQYKGIYLWMNADRGCARYEPIFVTRWDFSIVDMPNIKIKVKETSTSF